MLTATKTYIRGVGIISPQHTLDNNRFLEDIASYDQPHISCVEPNYKDFINPVRLRRMARINKMGVASATMCLQDAGVEIPDAIIAGTGLGCLEDTEKFLTSMLDNKEELLNPTAFIQSTHNMVAAQIALMLSCYNYNFTYVHRGLSLESALLDGIMLLNEGEATNVLVGGVDEMTHHYYQTQKRLGFFKAEGVNNLKVLESHTAGAIAGEGAAFFVLNNEADERNYARIDGMDMFYYPQGEGEVIEHVECFLQQMGVTSNDIDVVVLGNSGYAEVDTFDKAVAERFFADKPQTYFKHLCGEFHTASAFALWQGAMMLKKQHIPDVVRLNNKPADKIERVLIYNHFREANHSLVLLSKC